MQDLSIRKPPQVAALPAADPLLAGVVVTLATDGHAYMCDGAAWDDLTNLVTANNGAITISNLAADVATPAAGKSTIFMETIGGIPVLHTLDENGIETVLQTSELWSTIRTIRPNNGTTISTYGMSGTTAGTVAHPTQATTNRLARMRRFTLATGTTAGAMASVRSNVAEVWRGNAAKAGGFLFSAKFGIETLVSGNRSFVGLTDVATAATNINPLTSSTPGGVGVACAANTGNWSLVNNITGTARTALDLGASFPVNNTDVLQLILGCLPNDSGISYYVENLASGAKVTGKLTTNIPANTTYLTPHAWITNNATAASAVLAVGGMYLQSDE